MCREARESKPESPVLCGIAMLDKRQTLAAGRNQFCGIGVTGSTPGIVSEVLVRLQYPASFPAPGPVAQLAVAAVKGQSVGSSPTSAKDRNLFSVQDQRGRATSDLKSGERKRKPGALRPSSATRPTRRPRSFPACGERKPSWTDPFPFTPQPPSTTTPTPPGPLESNPPVTAREASWAKASLPDRGSRRRKARSQTNTRPTNPTDLGRPEGECLQRGVTLPALTADNVALYPLPDQGSTTTGKTLSLSGGSDHLLRGNPRDWRI